MSTAQHIFDGTQDNFQQLVLENSRKGAVLVNYWTPNAGPCFKLWQELEALCKEYQGGFLLVNINTDSQRGLARQQGITSVPTVKIYLKGEVVDAIYGAESRQSIKKTIDKYVRLARHPEVTRALRAYQAGAAEDALKILVNQCIQYPQDTEAHTLLIKLMMREKRYAEIAGFVAHLPDAIKTEPEINSLRIHARIMELAESAAERGEVNEGQQDKSRELLVQAASSVSRDDYPAALESFTTALQADRYYDEGFARKAMLEIFRLLGDEHELTQRYRKRLREVLH